jgi:hypothetical protein
MNCKPFFADGGHMFSRLRDGSFHRLQATRHVKIPTITAKISRNTIKDSSLVRSGKINSKLKAGSGLSLLPVSFRKVLITLRKR